MRASSLVRVLLLISCCCLSSTFAFFVGFSHIECRRGQLRVIRGDSSPVTAPVRPLDLSPAVDRFPRMMPPSFSEQSSVLHDIKLSDNLDPFGLVEKDLIALSDKLITSLSTTDSDVLVAAATHYFASKRGKRFRPTMISLLGRSITQSPIESYVQGEEHDRHCKLAQLVEMIHVASLIHDDVVDDASTRRGISSVHTVYGNKVAILAGDFLLARASVLLGHLGDCQVVQLIACALDSLVHGELMQAQRKLMDDEALLQETHEERLHHYLRKTYMKTASLMSTSALATALLSGFSPQSDIAQLCEKFGYHLGMCFQIQDDLLDVQGQTDQMGKPAQADLSLGLATAPILFACEQQPDMVPLIHRRFQNDGDVARALALLQQSNGLQQTRILAHFHAHEAARALQSLGPSVSRDALVVLLRRCVERDA